MNIDKKGWILLDLGTGASVYFEKLSDCFPDIDDPRDIRVGDKYRKHPELVQPELTPEEGR